MTEKKNLNAPFTAEIVRQVDRILAAAAKQDEDATFAKIASEAGCATSELYQWRTGRRPVPPERAPDLAKALGTKPELISLRYANGWAPPAPQESLSDEVESIRLAVNLLSSVMALHRPVEAAAAAEVMKRNIDKRLLKKGSYLRELIDTLEGAKVAGTKAASG